MEVPVAMQDLSLAVTDLQHLASSPLLERFGDDCGPSKIIKTLRKRKLSADAPDLGLHQILGGM